MCSSDLEKVAAIERLLGGETRLPACYSRQNEACQQHDTLPDLGRIAQPTLVMAGAADPICSLTATRWLAQGLPNARTENGHVGSRNISNTRGPWPQASGSARHALWLIGSLLLLWPGAGLEAAGSWFRTCQ